MFSMLQYLSREPVSGTQWNGLDEFCRVLRTSGIPSVELEIAGPKSTLEETLVSLTGERDRMPSRYLNRSNRVAVFQTTGIGKIYIYQHGNYYRFSRGLEEDPLLVLSMIPLTHQRTQDSGLSSG